MRISCPDCAAVYEVPGEMLAGSARTVRCARCGREWTVFAEPDGEATAAPWQPMPAEPFPEIAARAAMAGAAAALDEIDPASLTLSPARGGTIDPNTSSAENPGAENPGAENWGAENRGPKKRGDHAAILGWAATVMIVMAAAVGAMSYRVELETAWPPIRRAYALLGLG